jgi:hypothetical protein
MASWLGAGSRSYVNRPWHPLHGQFRYLCTSAENLSRDTRTQHRYAALYAEGLAPYGALSLQMGRGRLLDQTSPTRKHIHEVDRRKDSVNFCGLIGHR